MFTQYDDGCSDTAQTPAESRMQALVPCPAPRGIPPVSPTLAARLRRAADAAQLPEPVVLPCAAVSLFSLPLPLKTHRQRVRAMGFALQDTLCDAGAVHLTLGPPQTGECWLVAACDDETLAASLPHPDQPGVALPDVMALPRPAQDHCWHLWSEAHVTYVRASDGTGFVCRAEDLAMFWRLGGTPRLRALNDVRLPGLEIDDLSADPPPVDPVDLQLDLRHGPFRHRRVAPRRFLRRAAMALIAGGLGQLALLTADARALSAIADDQIAALLPALSAQAPGATPDQPLRVIASRLSPPETRRQQDHFMANLARISQALKPHDTEISFRELRYGARDGVLTLLLQGREFRPLQDAEAALIAAGLEVTSGTATATEGGVELLLQVRGAP